VNDCGGHDDEVMQVYEEEKGVICPKLQGMSSGRWKWWCDERMWGTNRSVSQSVALLTFKHKTGCCGLHVVDGGWLVGPRHSWVGSPEHGCHVLSTDCLGNCTAS